jgi:FtsP/CotA-like multicopper oxidase with cupredoxin domain
MPQINPGRTYIYKWKADLHGAFWWHSHEQGQIEDGMYGPITIHPKPGTPKPWHLISNNSATIAALETAEDNVRPLLLGDLRHRPSNEIWEIEEAGGIELPCYDSILINGRGHVTCLSDKQLKVLVNPAILPLLQAANKTSLTAKG